jgi:hypothetical protein
MYDASNYSASQQQSISKLINKVYGQPDETLTTDYASGDRVSPELFNLRNNQVDAMFAYLEDTRRDETSRAINAEGTLDNKLIGVTYAITGGRSWIAEPYEGQQVVLNPLTPTVVSVLLDKGQALLNGKYVSIPSNPTQIDFELNVAKDLVIDQTGAFSLQAPGYENQETDLVIGYWSGTVYSGRILGQAFLNDVTFKDDVTIEGNLIVSGTTTTVNSTNLDVKDRVVHLNVTSGDDVATPTAISGIAVDRGSSLGVKREMASLVWVETSSFWHFTNTLVDDLTQVSGGSLDVKLNDLYARNGVWSGTLAVDGAVTLSNTLSVTGAATLSSTLAVTGAATLSDSLAVTGNVTVNTDKFVVTAASGNTAVAGTLSVTGAATLSSTLAVTGNVTVNTNKFVVTAASGNTTIAGTLGVTGATTLSSTLGVTGAATLSSTLAVTGNVTVNTNKFVVTAASGNTAVAGTLSVDGDTTLKASTTLGDADADLLKVKSVTLPTDTRQKSITYDADGRVSAIVEKSSDGLTTLKTTTFSYTGANTDINSVAIAAGGVTTTLTFAYTSINDPVDGTPQSQLTGVTSAVA